jgi:hypothetical protein
MTAKCKNMIEESVLNKKEKYENEKHKSKRIPEPG